jgi:hypothetical protein
MTRRVLRYGLAAAAFAAVAWVSTSQPTAQYGGGGGARAAEDAKLAAMPTPKMADGHPDLGGRWGGGGGGGGNAATTRFDANGNYHNLRNDRKGSPVNQERDSGLSQRFIDNLPPYKPEFWDKVDYLDVNGNVEDTNFHCFPAGVPRMGPPTKIMATPSEVVFLYNQKNTWRLVPMNRPHDPINSRDQSYMGDSVGKWEGDTLVVDVTGFNEETWLEWPGYFHTNKMHVIERLRREGNTLHYQVTVEDPDVLTQPWVMDERIMRLNTAPMVQIEDPPCVESDGANLYTKERG